MKLCFAVSTGAASQPGPLFSINAAFVDDLPKADGEFEVPGRLRAHPRKNIYVDAVIKGHSTSGEKFLRELEIFRRFGPSKFVLQPRDHTFADCKVTLKQDGKDYFVAVYEKADGDFAGLRDYIHFKGSDYGSVNVDLLRQACRGIVNGFKYFHNAKYLHGSIGENAIRYTVVGGEVHIKVTNYGEAKSPRKLLSDELFKQEVAQIGKLLLSLVPNLTNLAGHSGNCKLLRNLASSMTQSNIVNVPSLELASSSLAVMTSEKRLQFFHVANAALMADKTLAKVAIRSLSLNNSTGWRTRLPPFAVKYITRKNIDVSDKDVVKKYREDTLNILTLAFNEDMRAIGADISCGLEYKTNNERAYHALVAFKIAFKVVEESKFTNQCAYGTSLLELNRCIGNFARHVFEIENQAIASTRAFWPTTFLDFMLENVVFYGLELETIVYALHHDRLLGMQKLLGNLRIVDEAGGCLFMKKVREFRNNATKADVDAFRKSVTESFALLQAQLSKEKSLTKILNDPNWWPDEPLTYHQITKYFHEVVEDPPLGDLSGSSGEHYASSNDETPPFNDDSSSSPAGEEEQEEEGAWGGVAAHNDAEDDWNLVKPEEDWD